MNKTMYRLTLIIVWTVPWVVIAVWIYVFRKLRRFEKKQMEKPEN